MSPTEPPRRGEIWWVAFDPSLGGEIRKTRPAVIVSNDPANRALNRVQVVPITSRAGKLYPSEAHVTVQQRTKGKAMADQIATVSKQRLRGRIGRVSPAELRAVGAALRIQLGLAPGPG